MIVVAFAVLGAMLALVETASLAPDVVASLCGASVTRATLFRVARVALFGASFAIVALAGLHLLFAALAGFGCTEVWMSMRRGA